MAWNKPARTLHFIDIKIAISSRLPLHFLLIFMTCEYCVSPFRHIMHVDFQNRQPHDDKGKISEYGRGEGAVRARHRMTFRSTICGVTYKFSFTFQDLNHTHIRNTDTA